MTRHTLANEIVQQALQRRASHSAQRGENDDMLIVLGAVLEEVSNKPKSLKAQGGIVGVLVAAVAAVAYAVSEVTRVFGR